jgi:hypothetical protein
MIVKILIEQKEIGRKKVGNFFVIFAYPPLRRWPGAKYIDKDGKVTVHKKQAARFLTLSEAEAFAASNGIELTNVHIEYFDESDM